MRIYEYAYAYCANVTITAKNYVALNPHRGYLQLLSTDNNLRVLAKWQTQINIAVNTLY